MCHSMPQHANPDHDTYHGSPWQRFTQHCMQVDGINFTCYNAGHVLGAAMFMIEAFR